MNIDELIIKGAECMIGWMNEWMNEWMDVHIDEWMNE